MGSMRPESLRVGALCKQRNIALWSSPNKLLRIAKRRWKKTSPHDVQEYFVVGVGDEVGHGAWVNGRNLRVLTALEQLAVQA